VCVRPLPELGALPELDVGDHTADPERNREPNGTPLTEKLARWPFPEPLAGGAKLLPLFVRARARVWEESCLGRSAAAPGLSYAPSDPFWTFGVAPGGRATFRKVMLRLTFSPAKTSYSSHRSKTRRLVGPSSAIARPSRMPRCLKLCSCQICLDIIGRLFVRIAMCHARRRLNWQQGLGH
jgi:hypothetical protein